jgi:hypothetical protein
MRRIGRQPVLDRKPWWMRLKYGTERTDDAGDDSIENKSSLVYPIIGSIHTNY